MLSLRQRLLCTLGLVTALIPAAAFAQISDIRSGVTAAANSAGLQTSRCTGTACVTGIIGQVISVAIGFTGVILLGLLVYAGFLWMTAGTSKEVDTARDIIKNAVIGLIIIATSYVIADFVLKQLSDAVGGGGAAAPSGAVTDTTTPPTTPTTETGTPLVPTGGTASPTTSSDSTALCSCTGGTTCRTITRTERVVVESDCASTCVLACGAGATYTVR